MYGKISVLPATSGLAVLPFAGNNRVLFMVAAGLIVSGMIVFAASAITARKAA